MKIQSFTFGPFSENTYILSDKTKECVIVDPGCYDEDEQNILSAFIADNGFNPVMLFNTHGHIDHVFGNKYVQNKYGLKLEAHMLTNDMIRLAAQMANMYGLNYDPSPEVEVEWNEGDQITFGETKLDLLWIPGHSPDSLCLMHTEEKRAIVGDVLFDGSIGRTDLPGGDHDALIRGIKEKLLTLDDEWEIYNGHGPMTTIGKERTSNPFLT